MKTFTYRIFKSYDFHEIIDTSCKITMIIEKEWDERKMVTMADIAKKSHVSLATVSRVISGKGYVALEKKVAVEAAISELGFVPNKIARGLKRQDTKLIGHIIPETTGTTNLLFQKIADSINRAADDMGYHVITAFSSMEKENVTEVIEELISHMVCGIIFSSFIQPDLNISQEFKNFITNIKMPMVMIERTSDCFGVNKVETNNAEGTYFATNYLIQNGHKKIAYIGRDLQSDIESDRLNGYQLAMKQNDINEEDKCVNLVSDYSVLCGKQAIEQIFQSEYLPTGIVTGSDILAAGVLQYLYSKKLSVPQDISLIGYDDTYAPFLSPPLCSVALPIDDMTRVAIDLVISQCKADVQQAAKAVSISPQFIVRNSVKNLNLK